MVPSDDGHLLVVDFLTFLRLLSGAGSSSVGRLLRWTGMIHGMLLRRKEKKHIQSRKKAEVTHLASISTLGLAIILSYCSACSSSLSNRSE